METTTKKYVNVMASVDLQEDDLVETVVDGNIIVLARVDGKVYAVDGICSHAYAELVEGGLDGHCIHCPLHFASFDIRDGSVIEGPTDIPLKTYKVKEEDGSIWIEI